MVLTPSAAVEAGWCTPAALPMEGRRRESLEVMAERAAVAARLQTVVGAGGSPSDVPGGPGGAARGDGGSPASPRAAARPAPLGAMAELPTVGSASGAIAAAEERGRAEGSSERRALQARAREAWEDRHGRKA